MRFGLLLAIAALVARISPSTGLPNPVRPRYALLAPADSVPSLARFFNGSWHCRGGTPAGKSLDADVTFMLALDARWLRSEHVDVAPGRYRSLAMWPTDPTASALTTTIYDNFGGARRFFGNWRADSIVWVRDTTETGGRLERFTFRRTSESAYWYAWHIRRGADGPVVLGDSATCRRSG
jgi:hypothetical protein